MNTERETRERRDAAGSGHADPSAGRAVVVTGAAGGIGTALAERLCAAGDRLVLADVDDRSLERLARRLDGPGVVTMPTDVVDPGSCRRLARRARAAFGRIDALVNCAGIVAPGKLDEVDLEDHRRLLEVNLLGAVHLSHVFLPVFREQGRGHLVHLASLAGLAPLPEEAVYSASKFGVRGLCLALDLELTGTAIRVTTVCPDSVRTPMLEREALGGGSPLAFGGRILEPGDVADAVVGVLQRPRREVLVPGRRGALIRLVTLLPGTMARLLPWLRRQGERGRTRYVAELALAAEDGPRAATVGPEADPIIPPVAGPDDAAADRR